MTVSPQKRLEMNRVCESRAVHFFFVIAMVKLKIPIITSKSWQKSLRVKYIEYRPLSISGVRAKRNISPSFYTPKRTFEGNRLPFKVSLTGLLYESPQILSICGLCLYCSSCCPCLHHFSGWRTASPRRWPLLMRSAYLPPSCYLFRKIQASWSAAPFNFLFSLKSKDHSRQ